MHFVPNYSSWLDQVERFFDIVTDEAIRRGSFKRVKEPSRKIDSFVGFTTKTASRSHGPQPQIQSLKNSSDSANYWDRTLGAGRHDRGFQIGVMAPAENGFGVCKGVT